jgi:hypothetical protein
LHQVIITLLGMEQQARIDIHLKVCCQPEVKLQVYQHMHFIIVQQ